MAALIGLLGNRALAWVFLGIGGAAIMATLYQGVKHKGAAIEAAAWHAVTAAKQQADRQANHVVDSTTNAEGGSLERELNDIAKRWAVSPPAAPAPKKDDVK